MSVQENKALARRLFEEFFGGYDLELADQFIASAFVDHNPLPGQPPGPQGIKWVNTTLHNAHSDLRFIVDDVIAEGDKVVVRWTLRGVHTGPMLGMPPSGREVDKRVIAIFGVADSQLVERWAAFAR